MNKATFTDLMPRRTKIADLDAIGIYAEMYQSAVIGDHARLTSVFRILLSADSSASTDRRWTRNADVQVQVDMQRLADMLSSLYREQIYVKFEFVLAPKTLDSNTIHFDYIVKTWMITKKIEPAKVRDFENITAQVKGAVGASYKNAKLKRLKGNELRDYIVSDILPTAPGTDVSQWTTNPALLALLMPLQAPGPQFEQVNFAPPFYVPGEDLAGAEGIALGSIKSGTSLMHSLRLKVDDLKLHGTILGASGAGKSSTAKVIVRQIVRSGIPVMVLDWHNEYGDIMGELDGQVLTPGKDFTVNPLDFDGEATDHISKVVDIFGAVYSLTHPQAWMLRNNLTRVIGTTEGATLSDLMDTLEKAPVKSPYDNETKMALQRRLVPLTEGGAGKALGGRSTFFTRELMDKTVAIELDSIEGDQTKAIFADILLKMVYDYQRRRGQGKGKDHLLVVEEAKNIAPAHGLNTPPSIGENMSSEVRKFGEMMLFVAQSPSQLAADVMRNSGVRIHHRLQDSNDLDFVRDSLDLNAEQRAHIGNLGVGEAVVSLARLHGKPVLVQVQPGAM